MAQITVIPNDIQPGDDYLSAYTNEIKTVVNQNDVSQRNLSKAYLDTYRNNAYINESGGFSSISAANLISLKIEAGDRLYYSVAFTSWGAATRRSYGFYTELPVSTTSFIEGGEVKAGGFSESGEIVAPDGAKFLVLTQTKTNPIIVSKYVNDALSVDTNLSESKINRTQNFFNGNNASRIAANVGIENISGTGVVSFGFSLYDNYSAAESFTGLGKTYTITHSGGTLPLANFGWNILGDVEGGYKAGFWVYTGNLQDASVMLFGNTFSYANITTEGYSNAQSIFNVQVSKVNGDWSYITTLKGAGGTTIVSVNSVVSGSLTEIIIANPTIIQYYGDERLNPYIIYRTYGDLLKSNFQNKRLCFFGDSQCTATQMFTTSGVLGAIVNANQDGGRAIKYRTGQGGEVDLNWLYHWSRMQYITELKSDTYIMHLSTNDVAGGGTLDEASIQAVIDNYPTINDDAGTVTTKLALFDAMNETTRESVFGFKQTYAALIRQLIEHNPETKIVLCTVPLSRGGRNTPVDIRNDIYPNFESINSDIRELSEWYKLPLIDVANNVGLNADNAVYYEGDGTHWSTVIQKRIGEYVGKEMLKLNV